MKKNFGVAGLGAAIFLLQACSASHFIRRASVQDLIEQPGLQGAQVGISLYDPATGHYLYNYQGNKYFVPASNTKLFTLYAGLKCLGDSLIGIRYRETDTALFIVPSGDPTFLHPAFPDQPVTGFLQKIKKPIYLLDNNWQEKALGSGWAWEDYNDPYMAERSSLPVYGNIIRWVQERQNEENAGPEGKTGSADMTGSRGKAGQSFEPSPSFYSLPEVDWDVHFTTDTLRNTFFVERERNENSFRITEGTERYKTQEVPFITNGVGSAIVLLKDTVGKTIIVRHKELGRPGSESAEGPSFPGLMTLHSRPVDSLFRPMMWHSDNFFAEQTLLMVSNERLGVMNDARIIDTLLNTDLKGLPQRPVWVDGSGLSRYDLFTPLDMVWVLDRMSREFGLSRIERLLPTGGEGTLSNYYKQDSAYIFAKTGSLTGIVALSGYLVTGKNRLLIFSILVNNYSGSAAAVRRKVESLVHAIRERY